MNYENIHSGFGKHPGCKRERNEDNYLIEPGLGLWVIADGMGGHEGGAYASRIVVDFLRKEIRAGRSIKDAIQDAHQAVLMAARDHLGMPGMGSTVVAMHLWDGRYQIAWVGDSRAYLWDDGKLGMLTRDHSFVQQMLDAGEISEIEAMRHPKRNVITQAIGARNMPVVTVDVVEDTFYRGQQVLLCSDGLTEEVSHYEIAQVLAQELDEQGKIDRLIALAIEHGGSDNISAVLIAAPEDAPKRPGEDRTMRMDSDE